jgi:hypothetical protein
MEIIVFIALILFTVMGIGTAYYINTQRQNEFRAIHELSSKTITWINDCLVELARFRSNDLLQIKSNAANEIKLCVNKHIEEANKNIDSLIDDDFFTKAAKAVLPRSEWKKDFENTLKKVESELTDQRSLTNELQEIGTKFEIKLREDLLSVISKVESSDLNLSTKTKNTLAKFKDNPSKTLRLLGESSEFKEIADIDLLKKEVVISIATLGTGISGLVAVSLVDLDTLGDLIGAILKDIIGTEFAKQLGMEIVNWLTQEIGEQVVMEFLEACALVVTGIGAVFTIFKIAKYISVYNRLFIEKELLQKMRRSAKSSITESLNKVGDAVNETLENNIDKWISELEKNLVETRNNMEKEQIVYKNKLRDFRQGMAQNTFKATNANR